MIGVFQVLRICCAIGFLVGCPLGQLSAATLFSENVIVPLPANHTHRGVTGSILQLSDKSLLMVYPFQWKGGDENALLEKYPTGGIAGRRSTDRGHSWSAPFLVQGPVGKGTISSPGLLRLSDGKIILHYDIQGTTYVNKEFREGFYEDTYVRISTDEGKTWTDQLCATSFMPGACHAMPGSLVQLSTGRLVLPCQTGTPVDNQRWVSLSSYSDDGGYSWWSSRNFVDLKGGKNSGTEEPVIAELQDGRLIMLCRSFVGYLTRSYSTDQGESWSTPELVKELQSSIPSPLDVSRIPHTDDLLVVWCHNPAGARQAHGEKLPVVPVAQLKLPLGNVRAPLATAISEDGGKTWKHHRDITTDPEGTFGDYGYPCITFIEDGTVALITYNAIDGIRLARIGVDWFYGR